MTWPARIVLPIMFLIMWSQSPLLRLEWMYLGVGGAAFLSIAAMAYRAPGRFNVRDLALLLLIAYLVHQFEEHGVDALGRHYAFMAAANDVMGRFLACSSSSHCPLNEQAIFWVNTVLVWWPMTLAVVLERAPQVLLTAASAGLVLSNAMAHLLAAMLGRAYNPGLVSAVVLFLPLAWLAYNKLVSEFGARPRHLGIGLAWGALGHPLLALGSYAAYETRLLPGLLFPIFLLAYASLPLLAASIGARKTLLT